MFSGILVKFGETFLQMAMPSQARRKREGVETRRQASIIMDEGIVQTTKVVIFIMTAVKTVAGKHNLQTRVQIPAPQQEKQKRPVTRE